MKSEFRGDILSVRTVEDCIRATRKYTKGAFARTQSRPVAVQGESFPSKLVTEYYEVYPDLELGWDMSASRAWAWVWGDVTHINVLFRYDYRADEARVEVSGGAKAVDELAGGIPGFQDALAKIAEERERRVGAKSVPITDATARE